MNYRRYAVKAVTRHLKVLKTQIPRAGRSDTIEPLHLIRTHSRRLRNVLSIFKDLFPKGDLKRWDTAIKKLGRTSGEARDIDVQILFISQIRKQSKNAKVKSGLTLLQNDLQKIRQRLQPSIMRAVKRFEKTKTLKRLETHLRLIYKTSDESKKNALRKVGAKRIGRRLRNLLVFAPYVQQEKNSSKLHEMRIAAKHLRYTLEALQNAYGPKTEVFIAAVLKIHRGLGEVHDMDMWVQQVGHFIHLHQKDQQFKSAISYLSAHCKQKRSRAYRQFVQSWNAQKRNKIWPKLIEFILP